MEKNQNINPTTLVNAIAKPRLVMSSVISFVVHIVLLGLLSISFIGECIKYKSTHPKAVIQQLEKEKAEAEKRKQQEEAVKKAQLKDQQKKEEEAAQKKNNPQKAVAPAAEKTAPAVPENKKAAEKSADPYANQTLSADKVKMDDNAIDIP